MNDIIKEKLKLLPSNPGCYLMKDKEGRIIYVGKAKVLKNRVKSYFVGSHNAKTTLLVSEIADFEYIITESDLEAFVLEINLIKKYDPKYNIKLTDDKSYPYILITSEENPRLVVSRNTSKKTGKRFGPYPNVTAARETVNLLNKIYPLRKCVNIPKKECLYYHLGTCLAPCINNINRDDYQVYLDKIQTFLKGNTKDFLQGLREQMEKYSANLEFERAQDCLNLINYINTTVEKQKIVLNDFVDRDIFGYYNDEENICIHLFYMRGGIINAHDTEVFGLIEEPEVMFVNYIARFYENKDLPKEILIPELSFDPTSMLVGNIIIPQKGDKRRIVNMAMDNAKMDLLKKNELFRNKEETKNQALAELKNLLGLDNLYRIEMFDNSNTFGEYPVSALVVYKDGRPSKADYRKYKVKTVNKIDDYKTMKEIVYRRYYRLLMEKIDMPNLLIMDGGKGQVDAALEIINSLKLSIPVIGLKKNEFHKTESIIYNGKEIALDKHSLSYKLLLNMQEEVHRFAITFHRDAKRKGMFSSKLDEIPGVGKTRKENLLKYFKSINAICDGTVEDFHKLGINVELMNTIKKHLKEE